MNRILVCLDSSPRAPHVLATANALARKTGAKLVLFRAVGLPPELPPELYSMTPQRSLEVLMEGARKDLATYAQTVKPELLASIEVGIGTAWDAICKAAHEEKVDLIVIGCHGYSALDRIFGTTAAKVVNHARRSVLVVQDEHEGLLQTPAAAASPQA